jgi:PPM family protein phosphatase
MSIGEFARQSRLSPKALRLYDGLGLLSPARVDELSAIATTKAPSSNRHG